MGFVEDDIKTLLEDEGVAVSGVRIVIKGGGRIAFADTSGPDEVTKAISKLDGWEVDGMRLRLQPGSRRPSASSAGAWACTTGSDINDNRLYIGNLPEDFKEEDIKKLLKKEELEVKEVKIRAMKEEGRFKVFAIVDTGGPRQVDQAISKLDGLEVQGRRLKFGPASPGLSRPRASGEETIPGPRHLSTPCIKQDGQDDILYIGNFPKEYKDEDLRRLLEEEQVEVGNIRIITRHEAIGMNV